MACLPDEICDNGEDDDEDGDTDCDDADCEGAPACEETPLEICDNGEDDDEDGDTDCLDADCEDDPLCAPAVEDCGNGIDDDDDGDVDCADTDCVEDPLCVEVCDNVEDDDGDGMVDCGDEDCADDGACAEDCINDVDDDGDGLVDCMDPACDHHLGCAELCNGVDDDGDGQVDEFPIDPRIGEPCYDGPDDAAGVGQCEMGVNECFGGAILCMGWVAPLVEELCDGLDNDCDGVVPDVEFDEDCGTTVTPGDPINIELETEVRDVDVQVNLDTTGSMGGELGELRSSLSSFIVPEIRTVLPTAAFGVSTFDDFPIAPYGSGIDWPFTLHQRVTTEVTAVQDAIDAISIHNGQDGPESGIEALYQIATGEGVTWPEPTGWTPENCDGGGWFPTDEDGDGLSDCDDPDCFALALCHAWPEEDCENDTDDDGDGYIDCDDPNCVNEWGGGVCAPSTPFNCGNSRIDRREQCDDGNTEDGDGCDSSCQREWGCGNAFVGGDETCDDGNIEDGDGCSADCQVEPGECGNGELEVGEECDDDNLEDGDGCDSGCFIEPECGNGSVDEGESCDDGNLEDGDGCPADCLGTSTGVEPFDWAEGYDGGLGHGSMGGVGFRDTAIPIVVHITDNTSHDAEDYTPAGIDAHDSGSTFDALRAIGARVVGVRTGEAARSDDPRDLLSPLGMTVATGAVVPVCAFDGSAPRVAGDCGVDECCTGIGGAGVLPLADGSCPLVFDTLDDGTGLDEMVVTAIEALTRFVTYDMSVVARDDPDDGVDATCFVESLGISSWTAPSGDCAISPTGEDIDGDGVTDILVDATPRTRATFQLSALNQDTNDVDGDGDTDETCADSGLYGLYIDVIADDRTVVATRRVEVEIP